MSQTNVKASELMTFGDYYNYSVLSSTKPASVTDAVMRVLLRQQNTRVLADTYKRRVFRALAAYVLAKKCFGEQVVLYRHVYYPVAFDEGAYPEIVASSIRRLVMQHANISFVELAERCYAAFMSRGQL